MLFNACKHIAAQSSPHGTVHMLGVEYADGTRTVQEATTLRDDASAISAPGDIVSGAR